MDESKITLEDLAIRTLGPAKIPVPKTDFQVKFVTDNEQIVFPAHGVALRKYLEGNQPVPMMELGGPREMIFYDPKKTKVGIVTCGGLCPGLNTIIRSLVFTSYYFYSVQEVWGFCNGYAGLNPALGIAPIYLTPVLVDTIHEQGGTILGSSRGPQDPKVMVDYLVEKGISVLYIIGGDGTMRGAQDLSDEITRRGLSIGLIGIPKTIDNDIALIERSFGFETAVQEASKAITCAHMEAKGAPNGIGLVKLMGRESGFIASAVSLANPVVNFCFIPEIPFKLDGPKGFLKVLEARMRRKQHAVIVLAEGTGQDLFDQSDAAYDASGNIKLKDIGQYLKQQIEKYFKKIEMVVNVKYIEPSYLIRSVPANADDNVFCLMLAQNAVHAGMSGRTDMVVGYRNDHYIHLPMKLIVSERKKVSPTGRLWTTVLETTGQPSEMI